MEALHAVFIRTNFTESEFRSLVAPMYTQSSVELFKRLYEYSTVDPEDIDDEKPLVVVLKEGKHLTEWEAENVKRKGVFRKLNHLSGNLLHLSVRERTCTYF